MSSRRKADRQLDRPPKLTSNDNIDDDEVDFAENGGDADLMALSGQQRKRQKDNNQTTNIIDATANETVEERRIRLTREYLESVGVSIDSDEEQEVLVDGSDSDELDADGYGDDLVAQQLKQQALRVQGKEQRSSLVEKMDFDSMTEFTPQLHSGTSGAATIPLFTNQPTWIRSGHRHYITSLTLADDSTIAVTGSHGGSINKHNIETAAVTKISVGTAKGQRGHRGAVWGTTISSDNIYLATAGEDSTVRVWDLRSNQQAHVFRKHREAATCVKFQKQTLTLYSSGYCRDIHAYDCQKMAFMETFYGPVAPTISMDCLYQNKVFISGQDCTARVLKPETETITSFQGHQSELLSMDCITAIDHENIVTGSQGNVLQLWNATKKKPRDIVRNAHCGQTMAQLGTSRFGETMQTTSRPVENWITALDALYASDLVASGSSDGYIRLWEAHLEHEQLHALFNIPVQGFVNGVQIGAGGRFLLAAVGKNNRLGTWQGHITKGVKEGLYCYDLSSIYVDSDANGMFSHDYMGDDLADLSD